MSVTIKLTVPEELASQANAIQKAFGYSNRQELILEGFRDIVQKKRVELLSTLRGKGVAKDITLQQRKKLIENYEQAQRDILTELGFAPPKQSQK